MAGGGQASPVDTSELVVTYTDDTSENYFVLNEPRAVISGGGSGTISGNPENNSTVIGSGNATGEYSIASGTNDISLIKDLVWPTNEPAPVPAQPAQALGASSYAHGAGTIAYTTNSVVMGVNATAGAKGFYWYNSCEVPQFFELSEIVDGKPSFYTYSYEGSETTILFEGVAAGDTIVIDNGPTDQQIVHTFTSTSEEVDLQTINSLMPYIINTSSQYFKATVANVPSKNMIILSETQPRISYNPDEIGTLLEDGTWAQERTWSDRTQTLLEGWTPIEGIDEKGEPYTEYAIISFYGGYKHSLCSKVLEVNAEEGYIIVDNLPDPWQNGEVTTIQWDEYLIFCPSRPESGIIEAGLNGFAIGQETAASGQSSFAQGFGSNAAGSYAVATGLGTEAGYAAFASGSGSKAKGLYAWAGGAQSQALGGSSLAYGNECYAFGDQSFALGNKVKAERRQFVIGSYNATQSDAAFIIGNGSSVTPSNAAYITKGGDGYFKGEVHSNGNKLATEDFVTNSIDNYKPSVAWSDISNKPGISKGSAGTNDEGTYAIQFGTSKAYGNSAFAAGNGSEANSAQSVAIGRKVISSVTGQCVTGQYNATDTTSVFIVGCGSSTNRKNALTLAKDSGNAVFSGSITMNSSQTLKTRTLTIEYDDGTASETIQMVVV